MSDQSVDRHDPASGTGKQIQRRRPATVSICLASAAFFAGPPALVDAYQAYTHLNQPAEALRSLAWAVGTLAVGFVLLVSAVAIYIADHEDRHTLSGS
jgi:hypothetical protein